MRRLLPTSALSPAASSTMTTRRYGAVSQSGKFPSAFTAPQGYVQPEHHPATSCTFGFQTRDGEVYLYIEKTLHLSSASYTCLLPSCLRLSALLFRARCLSVTMQEHTKRGKKKNERTKENPGLIKMPRSLCSLTILLFLS